ncbi:Hypothetical protein R9X50_00294400 [Acrodontium crateriforme]|uniref:Ankyrin repeat protein n=1 Tax=Acrodontium crateriforme TaxID=150365 RepID=A0AAQ3R914_9PEZI|nr:Hypothetical protein R9X50_00294400 [Acrodontium crateriforme]
MAELQTVAAVFDVLKLAWTAGLFLKKVKDADKIAIELHDRVDRLTQVLESVRAVLQERQRLGVSSSSPDGQSVALRIGGSIKSCNSFLTALEKKVDGFDTTKVSIKTLVDRFKIALKHPAIAKRQNDLEARISVLQTDLVVLQLFDQAHTQSRIGTNHTELFATLSKLSAQVNNGNKLLKLLLHKQRNQSVPSEVDEAIDINEGVGDNDAIELLTDCLRAAEDVHETYTSQYAPDDRSVRFQRRVFPDQQTDSMSGYATPRSDEMPISPGRSLNSFMFEQQPPPIEDIQDVDHEDIWPLELLNENITGYRDRADKELDSGHFVQAETNLNSAIQYSEMRERHYCVAFSDRLQMQEYIAFLYQKQGKYGEAVAKVHQLLRENTVHGHDTSTIVVENESILARQHQLLGSIYFDRHQHASGPALSHSVDDVANAEKHTRKAFNKRYEILRQGEGSSEEMDKHNDCIELLIKILQARDKTVEANALSRIVSDTTSTKSDSLRRVSTGIARQIPEYDIVENKHELLIDAIQAGDADQVHALLASKDFHIDRPCKHGKTALMYAVEKGDENTVNKLLDPDVGADINTTNKRGFTALHLAAGLGRPEMVRCLLQHDADLHAKDPRGETPIVKAIKEDQTTIIQILFDEGADMNTKNADEWSLLHHAVHRPTISTTQMILDIAPELRDAVDQAGKTALHYCAEIEVLDHANVLLSHKHRADVNAVDSCSRTPLYFAASKASNARRENMVRLLLKHGAQWDEARQPLRSRDYAALRQFFSTSRRDSALERRDSVSTLGTVGTTSTGLTKLSRIFSTRMNK